MIVDSKTKMDSGWHFRPFAHWSQSKIKTFFILKKNQFRTIADFETKAQSPRVELLTLV